jgi:hypothetical protein
MDIESRGEGEVDWRKSGVEEEMVACGLISEKNQLVY